MTFVTAADVEYYYTGQPISMSLGDQFVLSDPFCPFLSFSCKFLDITGTLVHDGCDIGDQISNHSDFDTQTGVLNFVSDDQNNVNFPVGEY